MPLWAGKGKDRGLSAWGSLESKKKQSKSRGKGWEVQGLCRQPVQDSVSYYVEKVGLAPVVNGVPQTKKKKKNNLLYGHTRGQQILVPATGAAVLDFYSSFSLVIHAKYCQELIPPVEDGTDASLAVLYVIRTDLVKKRLLSSIKTRIQRWSNKNLVAECVEPLWQWVRAGTEDYDARLSLVRNLASNATTVDPATVVECYTHVVTALVKYAQGSSLTSSRVYPYGARAAKSLEGFLRVPDTWFATTLAVMYPFLATEKADWEEQIFKQVSYPMTSPWPTQTMRRYLHFIKTFRERREDVIQTYEDNGGTYPGLDDTQTSASGSEEEVPVVAPTNSCDDVF